MKLSEVMDTKKHFVGTCINEFDEDGDCIDNQLPWQHVSDLAIGEDHKKEITRDDFFQHCEVSDGIKKLLGQHPLEFLIIDGIYTIYDEETDVHYFFN